MSRRASLPGAAELFRTTSTGTTEHTPAAVPPPPNVGLVPPVEERSDAQDASSGSTDTETARITRPAGPRAVRSTRRVRTTSEHAPTGRERHEEKITVYCSAEELLDLESARLHLRAEHGMAVDRGRIVREAISVVLADLQAKGEASILVRRLREP